MKKYTYLFIIVFIALTITGLIMGYPLLDSAISSMIITIIATPIKYFGDKVFDKIEKKWFSKIRQ